MSSSSSDTSGDDNQEQWDEWTESDTDQEPTKSLFSNAVLPGPIAAITHDAEKHGFDIRNFAKQEGLDEYGIIRLINYIRTEVKAGRDPLPGLLQPAGTSGRPWQDDAYFKPAMEDDPLLFWDYFGDEEEEGDDAADAGASTSEAAAAAGGSEAQRAAGAASASLVKQLQDENAALREALETLRLACMPDELREGPASEAAPSAASGRTGGEVPSTSASASQESSRAGASRSQPSAGASGKQAGASTGKQEIDDSYFDSYSGFNIHKEMISDKPRTEAYRQALECNPSLIQGKTVMDVGCGTGILSMFASRGGAARVVAVDGSSRIAGFARQICKANGLSSEVGGPMTVVSGKVEEIQQLPGGVDKVDVIVSEWMGYALLFETMLDTVLTARDRFLKPGGAVLPDLAIIYAAGATRSALGLDFWKDVYGFTMAPIADEILDAERTCANVLPVKGADLVTNTVVLKELDLCTMRPEDQDFTATFTLTAASVEGGDAADGVEVAAIVLWFDTDFTARHCKEAAVKLSTSPHAPLTHWAQTVLVLKHPVRLAAVPGGSGGGTAATEITCRVSMARNKSKHRSLDISLDWSAALSDGQVLQDAAVYAMNVLN